MKTRRNKGNKKNRKSRKTRKTRQPRKTHRHSYTQYGGSKRKKNNTRVKSVNKSKKWKSVQCSAGKNKLPYTCYSPKTLHSMKQLWNARHPDSPIHTNDTRTIWEELREKLEPTCNQEMCWMEQHFMKGGVDKELKDFTFAPPVPETWKKNPEEWLSSVDILRVMSQYEKEYPCFEFLGPSPIDYDTQKMYGECVWEELCNFSLQTHLKNGKRKIGVIFNLDPHYKEGSHWVALFIYIPKEEMMRVQGKRGSTSKKGKENEKKAGIYYFDSYGEKAEPQIRKFMNTVEKQAQQLRIPISKKENNRRHQYSESECGMFSMYFILRMLFADGDMELANDADKMFSTVSLKNKIPDKHMKELRKMYFNWV